MMKEGFVSQILAGRRIGLLTSSASRAGGGVFEAVVAQANLILSLGGQPYIFALQDRFSNEDRSRFGDCCVTYCSTMGPSQIGFAPDLTTQLRRAQLDCLHLHGIWMYPSRAGALWAKRTGRPYFISPHGMLDPWILARGRWKKKLARLGYEREGWFRATALHALTIREAQDIARETGRFDSVVIPNAGPSAIMELTNRPLVAVYIGRIHPKKNLIELVKGWDKAGISGAKLKIAGWGSVHDIEMLRDAISISNGSIEFLGPVFGEDKAALLAEARYVVLPSLSEGLPMAVLEAWANGVPTIMTGECNLPEGFEAEAALECGYAADEIAVAIRRAFELTSEQWCICSRAALELARSSFSADNIAMRWSAIYADAISSEALNGTT